MKRSRRNADAPEANSAAQKDTATATATDRPDVSYMLRAKRNAVELIERCLTAHFPSAPVAFGDSELDLLNAVAESLGILNAVSGSSSSSNNKSGGGAGSRRARGSNIAAADEHNDMCEVCDKGGDLLCCDTCSLVFHLHCIRPKLSSVPKGDWSCAHCVLEGVARGDLVAAKKAVRSMTRIGRGADSDDESPSSYSSAALEGRDARVSRTGELSIARLSKKKYSVRRTERKQVIELDRFKSLEDALNFIKSMNSSTSNREHSGTKKTDGNSTAAKIGRPKLPFKSSDADDASDLKVSKDQTDAADEGEDEDEEEDDLWCTYCLDDKSVELCAFCGCMKCFGKYDSDKLILCDACDRETHTYCMDPPLLAVPEDDPWYCNACTIATAAAPTTAPLSTYTNNAAASDAAATATNSATVTSGLKISAYTQRGRAIVEKRDPMSGDPPPEKKKWGTKGYAKLPRDADGKLIPAAKLAAQKGGQAAASTTTGSTGYISKARAAALAAIAAEEAAAAAAAAAKSNASGVGSHPRGRGRPPGSKKAAAMLLAGATTAAGGGGNAAYAAAGSSAQNLSNIAAGKGKRSKKALLRERQMLVEEEDSMDTNAAADKPKAVVGKAKSAVVAAGAFDWESAEAAVAAAQMAAEGPFEVYGLSAALAVVNSLDDSRTSAATAATTATATIDIQPPACTASSSSSSAGSVSGVGKVEWDETDLHALEQLRVWAPLKDLQAVLSCLYTKKKALNKRIRSKRAGQHAQQRPPQQLNAKKRSGKPAQHGSSLAVKVTGTKETREILESERGTQPAAVGDEDGAADGANNSSSMALVDAKIDPEGGVYAGPAKRIGSVGQDNVVGAATSTGHSNSDGNVVWEDGEHHSNGNAYGVSDYADPTDRDQHRIISSSSSSTFRKRSNEEMLTVEGESGASSSSDHGGSPAAVERSPPAGSSASSNLDRSQGIHSPSSSGSSSRSNKRSKRTPN